MSEDQRPATPEPAASGADDDVVVPHPFGPAGHGGSAGPATGGSEPAVEPPAPAPAPSAPAPEPSAATEPAADAGPVPGPDPAQQDAQAAEPATVAGHAAEPEPGPAPEPAGPEATGPELAAPEPTAPQPAAPEAAAPEAAVPEPAVPEPAAPEPAAPEPAAPGRRRDPLAAVLIGLLTMLLGFAFAVQVRTVGQDTQLAGAREEDLVRILDELDAQEERLRDQLAEQRSALEQLTNSDSQAATALTEAQERAEAISILNGTVAAQGPGLRMIIRDPDDEVQVADLLDAVQELRGAGAETMQIDDVRVGVSSAITGDPGALMVDGRPITAPYEFLVIGSPQDMATAMSIPGGVVQHINSSGGSVEITQLEEVVVDALRPLDTPQYASPQTDD